MAKDFKSVFDSFRRERESRASSKINTFGDIPDRIRTKNFWPFGCHLWRLYKELGIEYVELALQVVSTEFIYDFLRKRLDNSIKTAKDVLDGEIKHPEKVFSYFFFPPILPMRGDLSQGTSKLVYGESVDMTFIIVNDLNEEIFCLFNCHSEDGIPVDWWLIGSDDELLDRRHLKLGFKLRDIPKRTRGFLKSGENIIPILKDVRNERTPQWADSFYVICMVWGSGVINLIPEPSNYEQLGWLWDGMNSATRHGFNDLYFGFVPWPNMLHTYMMAGKNKWTLNITGLTTGHHEYIMPFEAENVKWVIENLPELWDLGVVQARKQGVPFPWQSLECKLPDYKKKEIFEKEQFEYQYPSGDWITPDALELTVEDTIRGVYLDIDHETPRNTKANHSHIISMGVGKDTEFLK